MVSNTKIKIFNTSDVGTSSKQITSRHPLWKRCPLTAVHMPIPPEAIASGTGEAIHDVLIEMGINTLLYGTGNIWE